MGVVHTEEFVDSFRFLDWVWPTEFGILGIAISSFIVCSAIETLSRWMFAWTWKSHFDKVHVWVATGCPCWLKYDWKSVWQDSSFFWKISVPVATSERFFGDAAIFSESICRLDQFLLGFYDWELQSYYSELLNLKASKYGLPSKYGKPSWVTLRNLSNLMEFSSFCNCSIFSWAIEYLNSKVL